MRQRSGWEMMGMNFGQEKIREEKKEGDLSGSFMRGGSNDL